jgi:polyhydroxybutyrate depolymerase
MRTCRLKTLLTILMLFCILFLSPSNALDSEESVTATQGRQSEQTVVNIGPSDRQAELRVPGDIEENETLPLVVALHGFSEYPWYIYNYFRGVNSVDDNRHLLLTPYGTENPDGKYFWNGTSACCDFYNQNIDDVGYLSSLISTAIADHGADQNRVMLIGHSNGGFMSHRMACDAGDILHTIVNFAGATYGDFSDCSNTGTPNIINVHGTNDGTIDYNGGQTFGETYASSPDGAAYWANRSGCDETSTQMGTMDLVDGDGNNETTQLQHLDCALGNRVTHWKLDGIGHSPALTDGSLINAAFDWAFNQPVEIEGCTDANATNYNENATIDDDSCEYPPPPIPGCMDSNATNYAENATVDDDSCEYPPPPIPGCMDSNATNYAENATVDDGSCEYPPPPVLGCMNATATNYAENATVDDGSCVYPPPPVLGCMNATATNYDENATVDEGSCVYPPPPVLGCMNATATNYDENATVDDDSCVYPPPPEPPADDAEENSSDTESEPPQKSGIIENINMVHIVLIVVIILLLSLFVLLQSGRRR